MQKKQGRRQILCLNLNRKFTMIFLRFFRVLFFLLRVSVFWYFHKCCAKMALGDVFYCYILSVTLSNTTGKYNGYDARWDSFDIFLVVVFMFHFSVLIFFFIFLYLTIWSNTNFRIDAINNTILILNSNCPTFQSHHSTQTILKLFFNNTVPMFWVVRFKAMTNFLFHCKQWQQFRKLNWKSEAFFGKWEKER